MSTDCSASDGAAVIDEQRRSWALESFRNDLLGQAALGFVAVYMWSLYQYTSGDGASIPEYFVGLAASSQRSAQSLLGDWTPTNLSSLLSVTVALVVAGLFAQHTDRARRSRLLLVQQAIHRAGLLVGTLTVFIALELILAANQPIVERLNGLAIAIVTTTAVALLDVFNDALASAQHRAATKEATSAMAALERLRASSARHLQNKSGHPIANALQLAPLAGWFGTAGVAVTLALTVRPGRSYAAGYWGGLASIAALYCAASLVALLCLVALRVKAYLTSAWRAFIDAALVLLPWIGLAVVVGLKSLDASLLFAPSFLLPWLVFALSLATSPDRRLHGLPIGRSLARAIDRVAIARLDRRAAMATERAERSAAVAPTGKGVWET